MEGSQPEKIEPEKKTRPRRFSKKQQRAIAVAVVIIIVAVVIAFWGSQPKVYTPSDILNSPQQFVGKSVQVRGLVVAVDANNSTFLLGDYSVNLTVRYSSLPPAFEVGKEMIVKGILQDEGGKWVFVAQDILVGHPK